MAKMLWQEYTTTAYGLGSSEHLPELEDVLKPQSNFWSEDQSGTSTTSCIPWKSKEELINAYILVKRCEEELKMLKSDMQETVQYWFQVVANITEKLQELTSPADSFTHGLKCKLLCLKEHAELQYHRTRSTFSKYVPLPSPPILAIPCSRTISEMCEDDTDTELETDDDSDISDIDL